MGRSGDHELESRLREERPVAPRGLVEDVTRMVVADRRRSPRVWSRVAFAAALTAFVFGGFASAGGLGYASDGAGQAADAVKQVFAATPLVRESTAAADQYDEAPGAVAAEEVEVVDEPVEPAGDVLFEEEIETLPFTGLALLPAAALGLAFLVLGFFLRRREDAGEE